MLVEVAILDFSKGIVHPYYISALAPGVAAMVAAGSVAFMRFAHDRDWRLVLLPMRGGRHRRGAGRDPATTSTTCTGLCHC